MNIPVDIRFRNLRRSSLIEDDIRRRAEKLTAYCGDLIACRVLVEVPHRHHEKGNRYRVRIDLVAPGTEIAVAHASSLRAVGEEARLKALEIDAMRIDVQLVVREAFEAARRRLQDYARRRRGAVKTHHDSPRAA
jgi:hypothetical protein